MLRLSGSQPHGEELGLGHGVFSHPPPRRVHRAHVCSLRALENLLLHGNGLCAVSTATPIPLEP